MPLTIAITGSNGTIGGGIIEAALKEGHSVVALDKPETGPEVDAPAGRYTYKSVDLTDYEAFVEAVKGCDALVHLAAVYSLLDPKKKGEYLRFVPEHIIHNTNTAMSWNALSAAAALGINRVAMASSVNAVGMLWSEPKPRFDYLPLDEAHPCYPQGAYSVCKLEVEIQGEAFARRHPNMRIASIRPHWVIPESLAYDKKSLHEAGGHPKDLWGWVSVGAISQAFLLALTVPESTFPVGHEAFFTVAPTMCQQASSLELIKKEYPEITDFRREWKGNEGFYDCSKAERMLGWSEKAFLWTP